jgi:hypothetical protein
MSWRLHSQTLSTRQIVEEFRPTLNVYCGVRKCGTGGSNARSDARPFRYGMCSAQIGLQFAHKQAVAQANCGVDA